MRAPAVKSPAVSEIDMHTSIVAAEAGPAAKSGRARRLLRVQIKQERSRP
jgi:hypothetical protein